MQDNDHAVHVLNSLIETTLDSVNGYRQAAENVEDGELRSMFEQRASRRSQISSELQSEVRSFGGDAILADHDEISRLKRQMH
jgi:uncharacterized protein (TIGR02284 family)